MNVDKHDSMRDIVKLRKPIDKDKYISRQLHRSHIVLALHNSLPTAFAFIYYFINYYDLFLLSIKYDMTKIGVHSDYEKAAICSHEYDTSSYKSRTRALRISYEFRVNCLS